MDNWVQITGTDYEINIESCLCRRTNGSRASGTPRGYYLKPRLHCSCVGYVVFVFSEKKCKTVRTFMSVRKLTGKFLDKNWIKKALVQVEQLNAKKSPEYIQQVNTSSIPMDRNGRELCPWARGDISGEAEEIYIF